MKETLNAKAVNPNGDMAVVITTCGSERERTWKEKEYILITEEMMEEADIIPEQYWASKKEETNPTQKKGRDKSRRRCNHDDVDNDADNVGPMTNP